MVERLGATGKFPLGSLGPEDEGELRMGVAHDIHGDVHINFGKSIMWFSMSSDEAIEFAKLILRHAGVKKVEIEV